MMRRASWQLLLIDHQPGDPPLVTRVERPRGSIPAGMLVTEVRNHLPKSRRLMLIAPEPGQGVSIGLVLPFRPALCTPAFLLAERPYLDVVKNWAGVGALTYRLIRKPSELDEITGLAACRRAFLECRANLGTGNRKGKGPALVAFHPELMDAWQQSRTREEAIGRAVDALADVRLPVTPDRIGRYYSSCFGNLSPADMRSSPTT